MKSLAALLGSLLLLSMLGVAAYGQNAGTGAIAGVVTDPTGAVVEGVAVKVTNNLTGETRTAVSAGRGNYTEPLLPPGTYTVEASKAGFKNTSYRAITVSVTEILTLNIQLQVGSVQETVEVTGQGEQLQTETSAAGRVTDSIVVESMPLVTRNYTQILALSTGVSADVMKASELGRGGTSGGSSNPNDSMVTAGGASNDNNFQMNGVEVNDFQQSGNFSGGVAVPNPDAIQEFKVQTGQYDASYGRDAGANVNVVTKTGTNEFHGTLFEFFRNDALNANDWFLNKNGVPRQELRQNQYGMTFGGPIVKNKLLFFTSYQGTRQTNGVDPTCSTTFSTPPLTNDRSAAALGALFYGQETYIQLATGDPSIGPSVARNGSNITAPALALLQMKLPNGQYLYPTPQRIDGSLPFAEQGSYSVSIPCPFYEEQFMTNADWNQSDKSQWQVRFFFANSSQQNTLPATDIGGPTAPGFPYVTKEHFRNFSLTYNHTFSNNLLNQAEIGYHRIYSSDVQQEVFSYPQIGVTISPGTVDDNPAIYAAGLPTVGGNGQNVILAQNTYVAEDTVAWQKGHHAIRFGGGVTRPQDNQVAFQFFGGLVFLTPSDFLLGQAGDTSLPPGLQFGNLYESIDLPLQASREWRVLDANAYFQDDYKVTSRLTLNLGLRYERLGDVSDALGRVANFNQYTADPNPPAGGTYQGLIVASNYNGPALPTGVQKGNNKLGIAGDGQNTWDPRIGFAWMVPGNDKVVLRGGYGVSHAHIGGQSFLQTISNQPWGIIRESVGSPALTFANPFAFPGQPSTLPAFAPYSPTSALSPFTFNNNWRPGTIQRYSLNLQTELRKDMMLEIGYIGTRGLHLMQEALPDQALDASPSNPIRGQTDNTLANLLLRVPVEGFSTAAWRQVNSEGASWYNGLEASLTKRFSHGVQLLASYTWAKELSTDFSSSTSPNGGESIGNQYLESARYGPDSFVRPQRFVISYVYAPPFFEHRGALLRNTLSGWKIAGVTTIQDGHPLGVENTNAFNLYGINAPDNDFAQLAPNCTVSQVSSSGSVQSKINHFINQNCFGTTASGVFTPTPYPVISSDGGTAFGNTRPGILRGPGQNNTDLSLIKNFSPRWPNEKSFVEFRAELFNAFNHPQFSDPGYSVDGTVNNASFGEITGTAVAPRIAQFALKLSF